jgi:hypothetical protein
LNCVNTLKVFTQFLFLLIY